MSSEARRYGGISMEDRKAERRDKLIQAAIQVASRTGLEGATVAAICAEAGLTARYFYESFGNREALFVEAYRRVHRELFARMPPPPTGRDASRTALTAFFSTLAEHPALARVFLLDLDERRDPAMWQAGRAAAAELGTRFAPHAITPLAIAGVHGAIILIAKRWIEAGFKPAIDAVVETALPFAKAGQQASKIT